MTCPLDNFDDASIDTSIWRLFVAGDRNSATILGVRALTGSGFQTTSPVAAPTESGGKLKLNTTSVDLNGTCSCVTGVGTNLSVAVGEQISVDWDVTFDSDNGTAAKPSFQGFGLGIMGGSGAQVLEDRSSALVQYIQTTIDSILTVSQIRFRTQEGGNVSVIGSFNTTVTSGKFKVRRITTTLYEGFYDIGSGFVSLGQDEVPATGGDNADRTALCSGASQFGGATKPISVDYDNYLGPGCVREPPTGSLMMMGMGS